MGDDSLGPWAAVEAEAPVEKVKGKELVKARDNLDEDEEEVALPSTYHIVEPDREAEKWERVNERKHSYTLPPRPSRGDIAVPATSTFHGTEEKDYQGRPWTSVPAELRNYEEEHDCFIPKKCVKKFVGHSKGIQVIELMPKTGHLLLSGSMDGKCKIWDVARDRSVLRTYAGHTEGVRSVHMSNTGERFLSSGFDRYLRLW